jgi:2'-hydroxyisoflavone reductase
MWQMDRRRFLRLSLATSASSVLLPRLASAERLVGKSPKKILVLGGTSFLGPAVVEAAVVAGHSVTLFNRGITNPGLFPTLEKLRGFRSPDRDDENFTALGQRRWDVVVDVWPSDPSVAESAARTLRERTTHYLYVSSIAAYDPEGFAQPNLTENGKLNPWNPAIRPYNRGKAESERRLLVLLGDRLTIVRPGPIKGDRDTTPDLLAWLRRAQTGTTHIGPGNGEDHVQLVDVKDVARFLVLAIDRSLHGTFNLTGAPMSFRDFLARCVATTGSGSEFVWIPREFLHRQGLDPDPSYLGKFPFWHPEPERRGFYQISSQKAFDAGWTQRPFTETALEYLWFFDQLDPGVWEWTDELSAATEESALVAWRKSRPAVGAQRELPALSARGSTEAVK